MNLVHQDKEDHLEFLVFQERKVNQDLLEHRACLEEEASQDPLGLRVDQVFLDQLAPLALLVLQD